MHSAAGKDALRHLAHVAAQQQRLMPVKEQIVGFGPVAAADEINVARAGRDDEAGLGALAFDERVDRHGRAVDQLVDRIGGETALADAVDHALHQVRRRRQALGLGKAPRALVEPHEIGEGSADIDGDDDHGMLIGLWRRRRSQGGA